MTVTQTIEALFRARGGRYYTLDRVSHAEHAVQCALLAEEESGPGSLVVAALLHDVGHLLRTGPEDVSDLGINGRHEEVGSAWLACLGFGPEVCEPVRLHVEAKRYLCATSRGYLGRLSAASMRLLELQDGPMTAEEVRGFESRPHHEAALRLRRIDDRARCVGLRLPGPATFNARIEMALGSGRAGATPVTRLSA